MTTSSHSGNSRSFYQWLILTAALLTLGGFIAYTEYQEHQRIYNQERERLTIQAEIIEKNLEPQIRLANRVIDGILKDLPAWQAENDGFKRGNRQLQVINDTLIGIRPILVIQADGKVIASSNEKLIGMNFANREYFQTALNDPDLGILHISAPFKTVLDTYVISLFRTIPGPRGEFNGIVIVSAIPEYFANLLDSVRYAPDMITSIAHWDGKLFLRSPQNNSLAGTDLAKPGSFFSQHRASGNSSSFYSGTVFVSGERRMMALRTIQLREPPTDKPLVIAVSRTLDSIFAPWHKSLLIQCGMFGLVSAFGVFGLLFVQGRQREQSDERRKADKKIQELAFFDQLTGLPNRILLLDRLRQTMAASARSGNHGAILFIDLDHFKTLNDTLGHDMGDALLKQVAQRLSGCIRATDTVARLGGDEFVVMLADLGAIEREAAAQVETLGEKLLMELNQPYQLNDLPYRSTPSIGVTLFKGQLASTEDLLKQADLAMYKSKAAGRNSLCFFDPTMEAAMLQRSVIEAELRAAILDKQFLLHYQPQVAGEGRVTGAEALVRWKHPGRGMISPAEFIPLAEETGLILPLGQWVLETACAQLAAWAARPEMAHLSIAVNVSALQFSQDHFVDQVLSILKITGANPKRLKLELTESLLVSNVEQVIQKMFALKTIEVGFSLDDFGTGYSSLSYLKRLPLDQLKIDQSFVRDVLVDPNDAAIAKTIVALAQSLGLGVIAEGVETAAQRDFLADAGCHCYQGYFFSRPIALTDFEQYVLET